MIERLSTTRVQIIPIFVGKTMKPTTEVGNMRFSTRVWSGLTGQYELNVDYLGTDPSGELYISKLYG